MRQGPFGTHSVPSMADQPVRCRNGEAEQGEAHDAFNDAPPVVRLLVGCIIVSPYRLALILLPSIAQIHRPAAGRPGSSAAIAPVVAPRAVAEIAGVGLLDQEIDKILAADARARARTSPPCRSTSAAYG